MVAAKNERWVIGDWTAEAEIMENLSVNREY